MIRYIIILLGIAFLGCERLADVDLDVEGEVPVVVSAIFEPDSTWRIRVDKAWAISEPTEYAVPVYDSAEGKYYYYLDIRTYPKGIENALVEIISGSGEQTTLGYDSNGFYNSLAKPRAGESYTLSVNIPGHPLISSSVVLPKPVPVDTAYITPSAEDDKLLLTVEFTDVPGPITYEVWAWDTAYHTPLSGDDFPKCGDPDAHNVIYLTPVTGKEDRRTFGPVVVSISDRNFSEQKKKLVIRIQRGDLDAIWTVRMRTLSYEYAQYQTTSLLQRYVSYDPFAQPVQVYNNIVNGVGIFAGYSVFDYHFKPN